MNNDKMVLRGWFVGVVSTVIAITVDPDEGGKAIGTLLMLGGPFIVGEWIQDIRKK